jgi:thymidylate synthase (methanogen type)
MPTIISEKSMHDAWMFCIEKILLEGNYVQDDQIILKEINGIMLNISNLAIGNKDIEEIWKESTWSKSLRNQHMFDYMSRLNDYLGIDQIYKITEKLKAKRETKSAIAITINPTQDISKVPCLVAIDYKIRNNHLNCYSFFRSQDVWKKQPYNILLLKNVSENIANRLGIDLGFLSLFITSAHIYANDIDEAEQFIRMIYGKTKS